MRTTDLEVWTGFGRGIVDKINSRVVVEKQNGFGRWLAWLGSLNGDITCRKTVPDLQSRSTTRTFFCIYTIYHDRGLS